MSQVIIRIFLSPNTFEDLAHVILVRGQVLRINEDVVQINDDRHVQKVGEDVVHETLKCCWCIRESKWHD